jgi:hypothetical protein
VTKETLSNPVQQVVACDVCGKVMPWLDAYQITMSETVLEYGKTSVMIMAPRRWACSVPHARLVLEQIKAEVDKVMLVMPVAMTVMER